jgi:TatD DNase family protein
MWIDTHCHLDAAEFDVDRDAVRRRAREVGVELCVIPAVERSNWDPVKALAHRFSDVYALGIHPLYVPQAAEDDLQALDQRLHECKDDARLVAVGEIGLDFFVSSLCTPEMRNKQWTFYIAQLKLAQKHRLPVILHVRRSADLLLKGLRKHQVPGGIAHAFNGSLEQARTFIDLGFVLGFGGALTFERALQLRRLATQLPMDALVMETDAPDIPPQWLYQTQEARLAGVPQGRNEPADLPGIADVLAQSRGMPLTELAAASLRNARRALPRLAALGDNGGHDPQIPIRTA